MLSDKDYNQFVEPENVIDDSKMPSPEEVAKFQPTPEIDKLLNEKLDKIAKEFGIL